jgi:cytochrome c oxidase subunit 4
MKPTASFSLSQYMTIWFSLLILTGITIIVAGLHLGNLSILTAITIAAVKSGLVLFYFMNLKNEDRVFKLMMLVTIVVLAVIMILTFVDVSFR